MNVLSSKGINVHVINESSDHITPDALFPNNWISTHSNGCVGLYPMFAENRRFERRKDILSDLEQKFGYKIEKIVDFSKFEEN